MSIFNALKLANTVKSSINGKYSTPTDPNRDNRPRPPKFGVSPLEPSEGGTRTLESIREGIGGRLTNLRNTRSERLESRMKPGLQNIAEAEAQERRALSRGIQGSRTTQAESDLAYDANLERQSLEVEEMQNIFSQENGLQNLENEFNAIINNIGAQEFSQQLTGLGLEISDYLAEKGASFDLSQVQAQASRASAAIAGRLFSGAALEVGRYDYGGGSSDDFYEGTDVSQGYEDTFGEGTDWSE